MSLIFNILPYYICCHLIPNTADEIAIVPQLPCPKLLLQTWKCFKCFTGRNTFHYLNHLRWRVSGWHFNKYMNVVFHNLHRIYYESVFLSYLIKNSLQVIRYSFIQNILPVLRYPHQMVLQIIYGMFSPSYSHADVILKSDHFMQIPLTRLSASHFHPASKLAGIQLGFL